MQKWKAIFACGLVELLFVVGMLILVNLFPVVLFPPLVAVSLSWVLVGSGLTCLGVVPVFYGLEKKGRS